MKKILLSSILFTFLFTNCKKDIPADIVGSLTLDAFTKTNSSGVVFSSKDYNYNNALINYTRFNFYMTDINLIDKNGTKTRISDAVQLDFTKKTDSLSANKSIPLVFDKIPVGSYEFIEFGLGVSPALNSKQPQDFNIDNPLHFVSEYWDAWVSFIFSKIEGRIDKDKNGTFETSFTIHTGGDQVFRYKKIAKPIQINANTATKMKLNIGFENLFKDLDLFTNNNIHQVGDIKVAEIFLRNLNDAITLDL